MTRLNTQRRPTQDRRKSSVLPNCGEDEEITAEDYFLLLKEKFTSHSTTCQKFGHVMKGELSRRHYSVLSEFGFYG